MEINERKVGSITIIDLKEKANAHSQFDKFQKLLQERLDEGEKNFVINLSECRWIDSAGLGELIRLFAKVMRQGGNLKLASARDKTRDILQVTNLTQMIDLFDTEELALQSFES
jgi:anti-sigma B factor antagonist